LRNTYTAKSTSEKSAGKEKYETLLQLKSLVIHGDEVCTAWKYAGLEDTEEDAADDETGIVGDKTLANSDNT
jgi:UDP-2,3-diacylglucosamine pyrophosphatase LpxH